MKEIFTKSVILRLVDYNDTDMIVTIFSENFGKSTYFARSAKKSIKRFGGCLDIMSLIDCSLLVKTNYKMQTLKSAELVERFEVLRTSLRGIAYINMITEVVLELLPEDEPNFNVYQLIINILTEMNKKVERNDLITIFLLKILAMSGYAPNLDYCYNCSVTCDKSKHEFYFDISNGIIICRNCKNKSKVLQENYGLAVPAFSIVQKIKLPNNPAYLFPLSLMTINTLKQALKFPLDRVQHVHFNNLANKQAFIMLINFYQYVTGKIFKTIEFYDDLS